MSHFNETIIVDGESLSFDFSLIHTVHGVKIFVVVIKNRTPFIFDLQKNGSGKWQILEPAPQWVRPLAEQFADMIEKNI